MKFHSYHGENIILSQNRTVAYRTSSFANSFTFSDKSLKPGEIFLIEIEAVETDWSGSLRIGLTQLNPSWMLSNGIFPRYALPDLCDLGISWIYGINKSNMTPELLHHNIFGVNNCYEDKRRKTMEETVENFYAGIYPKSLLRSPAANPYISPTDLGSRIGVTYIPINDTDAEMHYFINGEDMGPCVRKIPYKLAPIHAVIDVYGSTKKIRIIQLHQVRSLQEICRHSVLTHINKNQIKHLPLPKLMKDYIQCKF